MKFYSHGKLLITAEYAVLDGAQALCLPTKKGQFLEVHKNTSGVINWISKDENGEIWFQDTFKKDSFGIQSTSKENISSNYAEISKRCIQILTAAEELSAKNLFEGYDMVTTLEFDRNWGLGTSSTLINNIAKWLEINPYTLLAKTFKGSGYDIACANAESAITYQRINNTPNVLKASFEPAFAENIYFVYLNKKQNSREAIAHYRNQPETHQKILVEKVSNITQQLIKAETLAEFELLLNIHENLISKAVNLTKAKSIMFQDFKGSIKSLGAWGGDFIMVTSTEDPTSYFAAKGFNHVITYKEMIL